jgi:hypothetical protein
VLAAQTFAAATVVAIERRVAGSLQSSYAADPSQARGGEMSTRGLWLEGGTTFPDTFTRVLGVILTIAWVLLIAAKNPQPAFKSRFECSSAPWEFLRIGEILEPSSLVFIVNAHCSNAKYVPGWIELRYGGARFDVELRPVPLGGTTYYQIRSIGGVATP